MSPPASPTANTWSEREKHYHDELDNVGENKTLHNRFWHVFRGPNSRRAWRALDDLLRAAVAGRRVLEIGCGVGETCRRMAELGAAEVHGIDISSKSIRGAREADPGGLIRFAEWDAHGPFDGSYDVIFGKAVLHHLDYREVLPRLQRDNLRPGGEMIFFEPLGENLLLRLYWRFGTRFHTADERPFLRADLEWLRARFPGFGMQAFTYTSMPAGIVSSLLLRDADNPLMRLSDWVDVRLAARPFFQPRCRSAIFRIPSSAPFDSAGTAK